ncbi:MAG: ornithine cyclodeaminase family protein [Flavobacteriaceae bacterium]|nr:ornithine cyclodeaminase family protein [Flavobacteriaceae bacterium]MCY4216618.1 ornithine cyclodeaminase family protein [Flavobacteriaceae bacterium]MCY4253525.1 ornithine cyclodeaminase family protein [Flavobacteriaceae bacterium]
MQKNKTPCFISKRFIENNTDFPSLIALLEQAFADNTIDVPTRHHHVIPNKPNSYPNTLLIMPAWENGYDTGIKIVTVSTNNAKQNRPSIQGSYLYIDALTGQKKADIEATSLTAYRTAATSALASKYLSLNTASSLLMIGTGTLAIPLILAHHSIRNLKKVFVWGRNIPKVNHVVDQLKNQTFEVSSTDSIEKVVGQADIICAATLSKTPLIKGEYLRSGQHVDLVGSFKPDHRESDNQCIIRSALFVDTLQNINQSGDLDIPIKKGVISSDDVEADLFDLCGGKNLGRKSENQITLFKSVGYALEDLVAARYYYNLFTNVNKR